MQRAVTSPLLTSPERTISTRKAQGVSPACCEGGRRWRSMPLVSESSVLRCARLLGTPGAGVQRREGCSGAECWPV